MEKKKKEILPQNSPSKTVPVSSWRKSTSAETESE